MHSYHQPPRFARAGLVAAIAAALFAAPTAVAYAQAPPADSAAQRDSVRRLERVNVTAGRSDPAPVPAMQRATLAVSATVSAERARDAVNVVDAQDALRHVPSVFLRKRNFGDTQATMATRTWGVGSSARSLVFADGIPLTALIANNNTIGGPRWGLVSPEEIARLDIMYGPFSAAYAGNSMGAVTEITTRQPDSLAASVTQTHARQRFSLYGTSRVLGTAQTNAAIGNRYGRFSMWASGSWQESESQPLAFATSGAFPANTTGGFAEQNKLGAAANVLGATGLLTTRMANAKVKLAYDLTPALRLAYTAGLWRNDASAASESYVTRDGQPSYASQAGFASGTYALDQRHTAHALVLRSDTRGDWDVEAAASVYRFDTDRQRTPTAASASDTTFGSAGRVAVLDGTGWSTLDLKGAWHRGGAVARHHLTFGVHADQYRLANPTFASSDWRSGRTDAVVTQGDGRTRTVALWVQDAWWLNGDSRLTLGARWERWRAYEGFNQNGAARVVQPEGSATRVSPKAILTYNGRADWTLTGSLGMAYRFATPAELYQLVSTGATFTSPDPTLKPDAVVAAELRAERRFSRGTVRLALFQDDVRDAIISQFLPLVAGSPTLYSYLANVDHVQSRGAELTVGTSDLLVRGLDLSVSTTYLDARTLALSGRASATAPAGSALGRALPNIPRWRGTAVATHRTGARITSSLSARYSSKLYTTLDNTDVNPNTYQGFGEWLVVDARTSWRASPRLTASLGVDNLLDRKYFLFHPFPQRTLVLSARYVR